LLAITGNLHILNLLLTLHASVCAVVAAAACAAALICVVAAGGLLLLLLSLLLLSLSLPVLVYKCLFYGSIG
jgi:hypothetical protein